MTVGDVTCVDLNLMRLGLGFGFGGGGGGRKVAVMEFISDCGRKVTVELDIWESDP